MILLVKNAPGKWWNVYACGKTSLVSLDKALYFKEPSQEPLPDVCDDDEEEIEKNKRRQALANRPMIYGAVPGRTLFYFFMLFTNQTMCLSLFITHLFFQNNNKGHSIACCEGEVWSVLCEIIVCYRDHFVYAPSQWVAMLQMHPANEWRCYKVTSPLIGWALTQSYHCCCDCHAINML